MRDLVHAVWQFAPVCDDADRWLSGWPSPPDRSARIAAPVGGCRLGADRADELADMVVEVIAGRRRTGSACLHGSTRLQSGRSVSRTGLRQCASGSRSMASSAPRSWPGLTR